jgi:hypothetical protein
MKAGIATGLTLILGVALGVILSGQGDVESAEPQLVVIARHLAQAPAGLDDPAWQQAQPVDVHVRGRGSFAGEEVTVITRAAYTDDRLYFLFNWTDPTESVVKQAWKFDGQEWARRATRTASRCSSRSPGSTGSPPKAVPWSATAPRTSPAKSGNSPR